MFSHIFPPVRWQHYSEGPAAISLNHNQRCLYTSLLLVGKLIFSVVLCDDITLHHYGNRGTAEEEVGILVSTYKSLADIKSLIIHYETGLTIKRLNTHSSVIDFCCLLKMIITSCLYSLGLQLYLTYILLHKIPSQSQSVCLSFDPFCTSTIRHLSLIWDVKIFSRPWDVEKIAAPSRVTAMPVTALHIRQKDSVTRKTHTSHMQKYLEKKVRSG